MTRLKGALGRPWADGTRVVLAVAAGVIILRALVFVLFEQSYFDADQAVFPVGHGNPPSLEPLETEVVVRLHLVSE